MYVYLNCQLYTVITISPYDQLFAFYKKKKKQNTNMYHHRNASLSFNVMTLYLLKVMKRTEKIHFHKYKQKLLIPDKTNIELLSSFMFENTPIYRRTCFYIISVSEHS